MARVKENPGVKVSMGEYVTALARFAKFHESDMHVTLIDNRVFARFLGITKANHITQPHQPGAHLIMRQSAVDKIKLLNSPHWYAILKVREARKKK